MIWFACRQCGKTHGRSESSIGSMIFCDCGQGLSVPWESTVKAPENVPVAEAPVLPKLEPLTFEPVIVSAASSTYPLQSPPPAGTARSVRRTPGRSRDPNHCFNHENVPKSKTCADCELGFCADCLVTFQGQSLCGPCKNYRVRVMQRTPRAPALAKASLIVGLLSGSMIFCLAPLGRSWGNHFITMLALLPQIFALVAGILALRRLDAEARSGGKSYAITGIVTAAVTVLLTILVTLYGPRLGS